MINVLTTFSYKWKYDKLPTVCSVPHLPRTWCISRCCYAERGWLRNIQRFITHVHSLVLLIKPFDFWRRPRRFRRGLFTQDGDQPAPCLIFNSCFIRGILFSFFSADLVVVWLTSGISKMKETRLDRAVVMYWLTIRHLLETCLAMKNITFINCIPANRFWKVLDKS